MYTIKVDYLVNFDIYMYVLCIHTHTCRHRHPPTHTHIKLLKYQDNDVPKFSASPWQTFVLAPLCLGVTTDLLPIIID